MGTSLSVSCGRYARARLSGCPRWSKGGPPRLRRLTFSRPVFGGFGIGSGALSGCRPGLPAEPDNRPGQFICTQVFRDSRRFRSVPEEPQNHAFTRACMQIFHIARRLSGNSFSLEEFMFSFRRIYSWMTQARVLLAD